MPRFPSKPLQTEIRREAVARLRVRGLSVRAIAQALTQLPEPIINDKGESYGKTIIGRDLQIIEKRWIEAATEQIDKYKARQLAILEEVQRQGWIEKHMDTVLAAHDRIARLLGLNAPERKQMELSGALDVNERLALADSAREKIVAMLPGKIEVLGAEPVALGIDEPKGEGR